MLAQEANVATHGFFSHGSAIEAALSRVEFADGSPTTWH